MVGFVVCGILFGLIACYLVVCRHVVYWLLLIWFGFLLACVS